MNIGKQGKPPATVGRPRGPFGYYMDRLQLKERVRLSAEAH